MSIALPYHAWFVGHQTECPVSADRFLTLNVLHGSNTGGGAGGAVPSGVWLELKVA